MKVALCCIGRMENLYIREYVEYYQKLGVDKIFLYDNNHDGEDRFEDVIGDYVNDGFVNITDFRNRSVCQLTAYQDCYDKHNQEYDWICFFDCDEFLTFKDENESIKSFLSQDRFNDFDMIHVNWMCYGDNGLVKYENKPVLERFKNPLPFNFTKTYQFPENNHIKSIIKGGGFGNVKWRSTPHTPLSVLNCCDANGKTCNANSPFNEYNFETAWLRHYSTKSLEEWINIKSKRGYPDGNKDFFKKHDIIEEFYKVNKDDRYIDTGYK